MKDVCKICKHEKKKSAEYCYCLKYGCPIRYGRIYCQSWEKAENEHEETTDTPLPVQRNWRS